MQNELIGLLKRKGTGKTMGKSLTQEDLLRLPEYLLSTECDSITKATILTAILMLEPTEEEAVYIESLRHSYINSIPESCHFLLSPKLKDQNPILHKILNHIELTENEMHAVMDCIYSNQPNELKAAYLEGLRLKRETEQENTIAAQYMQTKTQHVTLPIPILIDIADPYDGFSRNWVLTPFAAPILAAIGLPVVLHGVTAVGPKYGLNAAKIIHTAHKSTQLSVSQAAHQIEDPTIGWAFIHQHAFSPESADLIPLRKAMVKRPVLATIEKLMMPIRATKTLLITGYTHPPYRDMLTNLMKNLDYIHTSIIIRGVEGATLLPLDRQAPFTPLHGTRNNKQFTRPTDWGITEQELPSIETPTAEENLKVGLSILRNEPSAYRDQMLYYCASIATFAGRQKAESLEAIQHALESGNALKRWEQAQNNAI